MTTSNDDSTQAHSIFDDEERHALLRSLLKSDNSSERRETLVEFLLDLREHLGPQGEGWAQVYSELHHLIEWLFKGSETYALALELYEQRFHLRGGISSVEVLRLFLDEQLS